MQEDTEFRFIWTFLGIPCDTAYDSLHFFSPPWRSQQDMGKCLSVLECPDGWTTNTTLIRGDGMVTCIKVIREKKRRSSTVICTGVHVLCSTLGY